jgi:hypothetical protein
MTRHVPDVYRDENVILKAENARLRDTLDVLVLLHVLGEAKRDELNQRLSDLYADYKQRGKPAAPNAAVTNVPAPSSRVIDTELIDGEFRRGKAAADTCVKCVRPIGPRQPLHYVMCSVLVGVERDRAIQTWCCDLCPECDAELTNWLGRVRF